MQLSRRAIALAVALLAAAVYFNALPNGFVFDDRLLVENNRVVRGEATTTDLLLAPYHAGAGLPDTGLYRPLTLASLAFDHLWSGLNPLGYHLVNVLLHVCVSLLLLALARALGMSDLAALAGALLFAAHPIHTEVVANVAGRAELLAAGALLVALLAHARATGAGWHWLSGGAYLLALLSKEHAAVFPVVALAWDAFDPRREGPRSTALLRRWRSATGPLPPLACALGLYLVLRWLALGPTFGGPPEIAAVDNPLVHAGLLSRWATAAFVVARYLGLLAFPLHLSADYSWAQIPPVDSPWELRAAGSLVLVAACAAGLLWWSNRSQSAAFCGLFAVVTFLPASNTLVLIGTIMAERLLYLPSVGLCLLAGCATAAAARWLGGRPVIVGLTIVLALCVARTTVRNRDWRDDLTLFTATVRTSPRSVKARSNLAGELLRHGRLDEASEHLDVALALEPGHPPARVNLAECLMRQGELDGAERELRELLEERPETVLARFQLTELFLRTGRVVEAEALARETLEREPDSAEAHARLGAALLAGGRVAEAEQVLRDALHLGSRGAVVHNDLGLIYLHTGRASEAVDALGEAVRRAPDEVPLRNNLANALREAGRSAEAIDQLETALELRPDFAPTHYNLGLTLERSGRGPQARERYTRAIEIEPRHADAHRGLGRITLVNGDAGLALGHLDRAIELDPDNLQSLTLRARAHEMLGRLDDAEADYRRILLLAPGSVAARNGLGIVSARRGDSAAARRWWEQALQLAPDSQEIRDNLSSAQE